MLVIVPPAVNLSKHAPLLDTFCRVLTDVSELS